MAARRVLIDCDPGQDDAVALLLAFACPDALDIRAVTAVAGNVPLARTERNARLMRELAGRPDIPVAAGCDRPLLRAPVTAEEVHGTTGIDGYDPGPPTSALDPRHAVELIVAEARAAGKDGLTLVATGPLTNVALAIRLAPDILPNLAEIVVMGGAMREGGNTTPSAEFNFLVDPHAAEIVLGCGRPIALFGLDVTHQVPATAARIARIRALGNPVARAVAGMLGFFGRHDSAKYGSDGAPLHDPCTVAWLLAPELFETMDCHVAVETGSELTIGHSAVDIWRVTGRVPNVRWAQGVDAEGFYDLLVDRLGRFGGGATR